MRSKEPPDDEDATESFDAVCQPFLGCIEKLTSALLGRRLASPEALWQFQLDLLHLQRNIQSAINDYKNQVKRRQAPIEILTELRAYRWYARRLGDAFAWVVLGGDKQILEPLSRNSRTTIATRESHGSRGMLAAAGHLAGQGWGFPLIHDITDVLRIGDITFVRVHGDSEREYKTVEVKTRAEFKGRLEAGNRAEYMYHMRVLSAAPQGDRPIDSTNQEDVEFDALIPPPARPVGRRIERQAKRMSTALLHQTAKLDELIKEDGETPALWAGVKAPVTTHWRSLQRVVRKARRNGYGSECVDDTFLYVAIYSAEGLSPESGNYSSQLQKDLLNPALLIEDDSKRGNVLSIAHIPTGEQAGAQLFRPFYLYPIPRSAIFDMLHGRMIILVMFNESKLAEALEKAGFSVEFSSEVKRSPMIVKGSVTMSSGNEYHVQRSDMRGHFDEIIYEFRGRDSIVQAAKAMFSGVANVLAELEQDSE
jgi:hypothetical protein